MQSIRVLRLGRPTPCCIATVYSRQSSHSQSTDAHRLWRKRDIVNVNFLLIQMLQITKHQIMDERSDPLQNLLLILQKKNPTFIHMKSIIR